MRSFLVLHLLFACLGIPIYGQQTAPACPKISIETPRMPTRLGMNMNMGVSVTPSLPGQLTYMWQVSSGKIIGDATGHEITVENDEVNDCESKTVRVRVNITGLPESCESSASDEFVLITGNCDVFPSDEYEATVLKNSEKGHLDNLAIQAANNPESKAYIILEVQTDVSEKMARRRVLKMKRFMFDQRKYPKDRFIFLLRHSDRDRTVMWLTPPNGSMPECEKCTVL